MTTLKPPLKSVDPGSCPPKKLFLGRFFLQNHVFDPFGPMKTPKCYTWLESCGSHLSDGVKKKNIFLHPAERAIFILRSCHGVDCMLLQMCIRIEYISTNKVEHLFTKKSLQNIEI